MVPALGKRHRAARKCVTSRGCSLWPSFRQQRKYLFGRNPSFLRPRIVRLQVGATVLSLSPKTTQSHTESSLTIPDDVRQCGRNALSIVEVLPRNEQELRTWHEKRMSFRRIFSTFKVGRLGLVATTPPHGSQSAGKADWSVLAGIPEIVILPDCDAAGEQFAVDVIGQLSRLTPRPAVRILRLPGLSKGGDIADWIEERDAIDTEALREQIEALADAAVIVDSDSVDSVDSVYAFDEWSEPIPLSSGNVPAFPIDAVPAVARTFIQQLAEFTQTPADLAAGMWIVATGICLQKRFVVQPSRGWIEQLSLFFLGAMEPANRKSAVVSEIASPLRRWEAEELERIGPAIRAAKSSAEVRIKQRVRLVDEADVWRTVDHQLARVSPPGIVRTSPLM